MAFTREELDILGCLEGDKKQQARALVSQMQSSTDEESVPLFKQMLALYDGNTKAQKTLLRLPKGNQQQQQQLKTESSSSRPPKGPPQQQQMKKGSKPRSPENPPHVVPKKKRSTRPPTVPSTPLPESYATASEQLERDNERYDRDMTLAWAIWASEWIKAKASGLTLVSAEDGINLEELNHRLFVVRTWKLYDDRSQHELLMELLLDEKYAEAKELLGKRIQSLGLQLPVEPPALVPAPFLRRNLKRVNKDMPVMRLESQPMVFNGRAFVPSSDFMITKRRRLS